MSGSQTLFPSLNPFLNELKNTRHMAWESGKPKTSVHDAKGGFNNIYFGKMNIAPTGEEKNVSALAVALSLPRPISDKKNKAANYDSEYGSYLYSYSDSYSNAYSTTESEEATLPNPKNFDDEIKNKNIEFTRLRSFRHLYLASVQSPHIQSVLYQDGSRKITERMTGSLRTLIECPSGVRIDLKEIIAQILKAVYHLHQKNLAHRDIKPLNFLYQSRGNDGLDSPLICLSDLDSITYTGVNPDPIYDNLRTKGYAAPELNRKSAEEIDRLKVDCYAVGKTIEKLLILTKKQSVVNAELENKILNLAPYLTRVDPQKRISIDKALLSRLFGNTPDEIANYFHYVSQKFYVEKHIDGFYLSGYNRYPYQNDTFMVLSAPMKMICLTLQKLRSIIHYLHHFSEEENDTYLHVYSLNVLMREVVGFYNLLKTHYSDKRLNEENRNFIKQLIEKQFPLVAILNQAQEMTGNHLEALKAQISDIDNHFHENKYHLSESGLKVAKRNLQRSFEMKKLYLASKSACLMGVDSNTSVAKQERILQGIAVNNYNHQEAMRFIDARLHEINKLTPIMLKVSQAVRQYIAHNNLQNETRYGFFDVLKKHNFHGKQYAEYVLAEICKLTSEQEMMTYLHTHYQTGLGGHKKNSFKSFLQNALPELTVIIPAQAGMR